MIKYLQGLFLALMGRYPYKQLSTYENLVTLIVNDRRWLAGEPFAVDVIDRYWRMCNGEGAVDNYYAFREHLRAKMSRYIGNSKKAKDWSFTGTPPIFNDDAKQAVPSGTLRALPEKVSDIALYKSTEEFPSEGSPTILYTIMDSAGLFTLYRWCDGSYVELPASADNKITVSAAEQQHFQHFVSGVMLASSIEELPMPGNHGEIYHVVNGTTNAFFHWSNGAYVEAAKCNDLGVDPTPVDDTVINDTSHLVVCVNEEAIEIADIALKIAKYSDKALRFGLGSKCPGDPNARPHIASLVDEYNDLTGAMEALRDAGVEMPLYRDRKAIDAKKEKIHRLLVESKQSRSEKGTT